MSAARSATEYQHQVSQEDEAANIQTMLDNGVEIYNLSDEERQLFP